MKEMLSLWIRARLNEYIRSILVKCFTSANRILIVNGKSPEHSNTNMVMKSLVIVCDKCK